MKLPNFSYRSALIGALLAISSGMSIADTHATATLAAARRNKPAVDNIGEFANFGEWKDVGAFIDMMVDKHGFSREELEHLFKNTRYIDSAIQLIKPAPSSQPKNWQAYRARFIEPVRIAAGVAFWDNYADALARAEKEYGVPPEIIIAILGVETLFGRNIGTFRVMDVLTTLSFAYPDTPNRSVRMDYFRSELENALLLARESGIDPFTLRGSYAGAIGWPQFMPASIRQYAVDYDGNGRIDLYHSPVDAIGSIANFLMQHGWQRGEPMVFPVTVSPPSNNITDWRSFIAQELEAKFKLSDLEAAGVHAEGTPPADILLGLIDLQNGTAPTEYWLGERNFFVITQYNRSYFYAMSIVDLGKAVRHAREKAQSKPLDHS